MLKKIFCFFLLFIIFVLTPDFPLFYYIGLVVLYGNLHESEWDGLFILAMLEA